MNFSGRGSSSTKSTGRVAKSCLSTSIRRRPCSAYSCSSALTSDDLPVPRAPVSKTLLAARPARNCSVLRTSCRIWVSMAARRFSGKVCGRGRLCKMPRLPAFCQRKAMLAAQSGARSSGGSSASKRLSTDKAFCTIGLMFLNFMKLLFFCRHADINARCAVDGVCFEIGGEQARQVFGLLDAFPGVEQALRL